ncbi:MAG TPA: penicillin-binding transpeptidase domain-containing protein, partial [Spirochaetota bacterium]|nr:penicillin-binding transpeptidase domain-containing protein [Spirochaetota bacterium]
LYSPYKHPERSRKRHRTVINVLVDREIIPATYAEREFEQHWQKFRENKQHLVTSFWKMQINKAPYAVESIRRQLAAVMTRQQITRGGLKIISSLDLRFNNTARAVTKKFLTTINAEQSNNNEKVECALVAIDNQTGGILSAVGGSGFSFANELIRYSQIRRPVGSLVKPFIYTFAAAELNYKPGTLVRDEPLKIKIPDGIWQPQNYDRKFMGKITMSTALMRSRNIPSVRTAGRLGVAKVKNFLCRAFAVENDRIPADLSIALGSCSLSPLEVVAAYSRFSSSKIDYFPFLIQNIFSNDVKLRQLPSKRRYKHNIATESVLEIIRKILIKVVNEKGGTAFRPMQQYGPSGITLAGKTGTTQDYRDVWFTAFTPRLSCTVWIGYDSNAKLDKVSGSRTAAPVVLSYLRRIYRHLPVKRFK